MSDPDIWDYLLFEDTRKTHTKSHKKVSFQLYDSIDDLSQTVAALIGTWPFMAETERKTIKRIVRDTREDVDNPLIERE